MPKRTLDDDEKALWEKVTQGDKPLLGVKKKAEKKTKPVASKKSPQPAAALPTFYHEAPLEIGSYAGIDRNTGERFRKGEMEIDGTLDLHGMTQEKAFAALMKFISSHVKRQSRMLLVITGKGGEGRGVLRAQLPHWLATGEVRSHILACDVAKQKHGGSGAFYILLRRARNSGG